jgi:hypothetical protein
MGQAQAAVAAVQVFKVQTFKVRKKKRGKIPDVELLIR